MPASAVEAPSPTPRLAVTHDGGVTVLDATDLETIADFPLDGFLRLNPAGDGWHVLISAGSRFGVLDTGSWTRSHGDHAHHHTAEPALADWAFEVEEAGHVVHHAGLTTLFDDGTGRVESFDPRDLASGRPATVTRRTAQAHPRVAVDPPGGGLVTTIGDAESAAAS